MLYNRWIINRKIKRYALCATAMIEGRSTPHFNVNELHSLWKESKETIN